jgi:hypothetical protein
LVTEQSSAKTRKILNPWSNEYSDKNADGRTTTRFVRVRVEKSRVPP